MLDHVDWFPYVKPSLHPRDEAYLIMVSDCIDVFLDLVRKNFVEYCIKVHKWDWSEVLFPCGVFVEEQLNLLWAVHMQGWVREQDLWRTEVE